MPDPVLDDISHRRYNPLRGSWILVSPHRTKRPWQGQQEAPGKTTLPEYDSDCYLCPGNKRAQGDANPQYENTFVFVNDYSAVKEEQAPYDPPEHSSASLSSRLLQASPSTGRCYVLTFSKSHNRTLADLSPEEIVPIINAWTNIYAAHLSPTSPLTKTPTYANLPPTTPSTTIPKPKAQYKNMQIFENKGSAMGCSNPHPHGQIWTTSHLPEEPSAEITQQILYRQQHGPDSNLLHDYAQLESSTSPEESPRLIHKNASFITLCPWWATWPFETLILPLSPQKRSLLDFNPSEREHLAESISEITRRYDNLFETHFPYSMGLHQAPLFDDKGGEETEASQFHIHFYPPLLRSATVRKFLVGYELLAEPQRDITPEQAAARLRASGGELYRRKMGN